MTWNREQQQCSQSCLFIVKFETTRLIKEMRSSHYKEQQLIKACTWENKCCSFLFHSFLRALWTWSTLVHNFIFSSVTHNLFHLAEKDLKCCKARAEMKEYRNNSLPPHSAPTFPNLTGMSSSYLVGSHFPALRTQQKMQASWLLPDLADSWLRKMLGKRAVLPSPVCCLSLKHQARTLAGR